MNEPVTKTLKTVLKAFLIFAFTTSLTQAQTITIDRAIGEGIYEDFGQDNFSLEFVDLDNNLSDLPVGTIAYTGLQDFAIYSGNDLIYELRDSFSYQNISSTEYQIRADHSTGAFDLLVNKVTGEYLLEVEFVDGDIGLRGNINNTKNDAPINSASFPLVALVSLVGLARRLR